MTDAAVPESLKVRIGGLWPTPPRRHSEGWEGGTRWVAFDPVELKK